MIVRMQGLGGLGAAGEAVPLQYVVRDMTRAWNGRTFTAAEVIPVLAKSLELAQAFEATAQHVGSIPEAQRRAASRNRQQLEYLAALMFDKGSDPYRFASSHKTWKDVRAATLAPVIWLSGVIEMHGVHQSALAEISPKALIRSVLELPGQVVAAAAAAAAMIVENAVRPLMPKGKILPGWVAPVLVGGVALGAGAWLYSTLKKVTP